MLQIKKEAHININQSLSQYNSEAVYSYKQCEWKLSSFLLDFILLLSNIYVYTYIINIRFIYLCV